MIMMRRCRWVALFYSLLLLCYFIRRYRVVTLLNKQTKTGVQ